LHYYYVQVKPKGLNYVQTMMCGSCGVENAFKAAMIKYRVKEIFFWLS